MQGILKVIMYLFFFVSDVSGYYLKSAAKFV